MVNVRSTTNSECCCLCGPKSGLQNISMVFWVVAYLMPASGYSLEADLVIKPTKVWVEKLFLHFRPSEQCQHSAKTWHSVMMVNWILCCLISVLPPSYIIHSNKGPTVWPGLILLLPLRVCEKRLSLLRFTALPSIPPSLPLFLWPSPPLFSSPLSH